MFLFAAGFVSCKKCIECKAENGPSGMESVKQEYCGNSTQRTAFESSWKSTYEASGYDDVKCD